MSNSGDPMDHSLPFSSAHGFSQARILEWDAIPFPRGSSWSRDWTLFSCTAGRFFTTEPPGKPWCQGSIALFSHHGWHSSTGSHLKWLLQHLCPLCSTFRSSASKNNVSSHQENPITISGVMNLFSFSVPFSSSYFSPSFLWASTSIRSSLISSSCGSHQLPSEAKFQRTARRDKKAFLRDQCKEIEENNRIGKTRGLLKKIREGNFPSAPKHFMQRWVQ